MKLTHGVLLLFFSLVFLGKPRPVSAQIDFPYRSDYSFLRGSEAGGLTPGWIQPGFNDAAWEQGAAPLHYGDGTGGTFLLDMQNNYSTVYMRSRFFAENLEFLEEVTLTFDYDDGFIIWINGTEVLRRNAPQNPTSESFAPENHESGTSEFVGFDAGDLPLVEGENVLAVMGFNVSLESSDFYFDLDISAGIMEPVLEDTVGLAFSHAAGFYEDPFTLDITAADPAWDVLYTLDGSNPRDSETAYSSIGSASILIDPASTAGRDATPAVTVRACSAVDTLKPSFPVSRTYIFLDKVLEQDYPGGEWPAENVQGILEPNAQYIDLPMDQEIVNHPDYAGSMVESMKDIPSLSVVTDLDNLFDPQIGIYVNASGHGHDWERECNVELIYPDGTDGFSVPAGLRIRGGWSRHHYFAKHSFRLFFRSKYGDAKLDYPLFGEEGVDRFDKIDIRTAQNHSWARGDSEFTMLRDVFSRDTQRDMGQPYTRSRYYHLYLNGMYWGLYQTQERSEARFAADYMGGSTGDYDVVKVNTEDWNYSIEATDGSLDSWGVIWDMVNDGFSDNAAYFALEGKDENGDPMPGAEVHVDIDNLIDYLLTIFYTANFDAPTSSFGNNRGPNNFYAIFNRDDLSEGFRFFNHDAEHTLFPYPVEAGTGLNEDRVNLDMAVSGFSAFHPQWLHKKLTENEEYRVRFRDRAFMHMEGNGPLTVEENRARLEVRFDEMEKAVIGHSARWGDGPDESAPARTRNDNWLPEVNKIRNDFFPYRTDIVIGQLDNAGLYTETDPPVIMKDGQNVYERQVALEGTSTIRITNPNSFGAIYYTLDGTDPREVGGTVSPKAQGATSEASLELEASAWIKARVKYADEWSAIRELKVTATAEDYSGLVITEINYHPLPMPYQGDTISGKDLEFLEFKNIGTSTIHLGGLVLDSAVYHEFPAGTMLPSGGFYVVASKPSKFYLKYGMSPSGNSSKNLSNGGEIIRLEDASGNPLILFMYSDESPWPIEADGMGYSLVPKDPDPTGQPADYRYWRASTEKGGSPFRNDPFPLTGNPDMKELAGPVVYPNPTGGMLYFKWDSDVPGPVEMALLDLNGRELYRTSLYGDEGINLGHLGLTDGVYVVRLVTDDQMYVKKIMYRNP